MGKRIAASGDKDEVYVASRFFGHYAVLFLGFHQRDHVHSLELPETLALPGKPPERGVLFALDEGKTGLLQLIEDLYPGGTVEKVKDPWGHSIVYFYHVGARSSAMGQLNAQKYLVKGWGLSGSFYPGFEMKGVPLLMKWDPLLNFTFRNDFPLNDFPPPSIRWIGRIRVPEKGLYQFMALATDPTTLILDGKKLFGRENTESQGLMLKKGAHKIEVLFQKKPYTVKEEGQATAMTLLWKKPKEDKFEVVPYSVFRR